MEVEIKMDYKLEGKIVISGKIEIETGLTIGGSKTSLDIGGMDNPVIKDSKGIPYIPGSTIKGKLRSLLEQCLYPLRYKDENDGGGYFDESMVIHKFKDPSSYSEDPVTKIFGNPDVNEPGRGIFRDSYLDEIHFNEHRNKLFKNLDLEFTEDKIENSIDRISASAVPRHLERVPNGAQFNFEIILDLFSSNDQDLLKELIKGLKLLEDDYLGGSGTRGSGKVAFKDIQMVYRSVEYYASEKDEISLIGQVDLIDIVDEKWYKDVFDKINL